ncbi:unnamed protein product, partial [Scytosiphon promiscuus]
MFCSQQGFELVPLVITVGDYVLTPEICVERKSLSDLFQSMTSGRLFNQVEAMLKHYKVPVLLIEFNPDKVSWRGALALGEECSTTERVS